MLDWRKNAKGDWAASGRGIPFVVAHNRLSGHWELWRLDAKNGGISNHRTLGEAKRAADRVVLLDALREVSQRES